MDLTDYKQLFLKYLQKNILVKQPINLYKPVEYILQLGGKRLRPILVLLSTDAFGENPEKALDVALSVEVFHNFSLLHDDIMDEAPLRRGEKTVHEKWNINTGILSGDVMLINAYQYLENYDAITFKKLIKVFSRTAQEVCEGQQYDIDFETRDKVRLSEYLKMIEYKTSVLVAAALKMGAIVAGASKEQQEQIYEFGIQIGLAFQLQDDYLDTFGNAKTFGKQIGGDILENKKTWLYLKTLEKSKPEDVDVLNTLYTTSAVNGIEKIDRVKRLFMKYKVDEQIKTQIAIYSSNALDILLNLAIRTKPKRVLEELVMDLEKRNQ